MANIVAKPKYLLLCGLIYLFTIALHLHAEINPKVEAIYQFGDSISDTGNLIRDNPNGERLSFAHLPYGETLGIPTGRCSDGLLMVDYFAEYFKLPYLDAYLNKDGNFSHGVNFAVAGSTALSTQILAAQGIMSPATRSSLSVQLDWFRSHLQSICSNPPDCQSKLANALFIVESGGNDFNFAFLQGKTMQEVYGMVPQVIGALRSVVEELIDLGASRIVIPGNFPIGCLPIYLATFQTNNNMMYDQLGCLTDLNEFATFQNNFLQQTIVQIQMEHPHVTVVYGDYFSALQGLLQNAASLGFNKEETHTACCGMGGNIYNFDVSRMCGSETPVCQDPYKRVSWDGIHMTQHAYNVLATWLLNNNIVPHISKPT
ncbi:hypothetical protein RDABS01_038969 [Bienertia sinuspersici]